MLKVVEPIWTTKTTTAARVRNRIEDVLDWCTVSQHRKGDNPARWEGHLDQVLPRKGDIAPVKHHAALAYTELPAFMTELRAFDSIGARALEYTILVAARSGETIGAKWNEINFDTATWTVPASRMKAGKEHRVPLSSAAIKLLKELPREDGNPFVFIGKFANGISSFPMRNTLSLMGRTGITVHGFRSTFRDWRAETTGYPNHVVEQALAHTISNAVEAAYRRGDLFAKRIRLMEDWGKYCSSSASSRKNVVSIR